MKIPGFALELVGDGKMMRSAVFSSCGLFRYRLERRWSERGPIDLYIGANPSVAGAKDDDHTARKMIGFSKRWGSIGYDLLNLHAFVAKNPEDFKVRASLNCDVDGPDNERWLALGLESKSYARIVVAWGDCLGPHGLKRARQILGHATARGIVLQCLGTTASGNPRHPLVLPYSTKLRPWRPT